jgi:hypothetical protein
MEKVVKILSMKDKKNDFDFWMSKSVEERLEAIQRFRNQYFALTGYVREGFPQVCRIIRKV